MTQTVRYGVFGDDTRILVSRGYTSAEKTLAANYRPGDTVAFHRPYKRLGVEKGDELRVARVDRTARTVDLEGADGGEVYRGEAIELRAGDRIRWTRNDAGLGLVNSGTAEVAAVRGGRVTFRLEDGRMLDFAPGVLRLRHLTAPGPRPCMRSRAAPSTP